jgi:hypothetical protein
MIYGEIMDLEQRKKVALDYLDNALRENYDYKTSWAGLTYHIGTLREVLQPDKKPEGIYFDGESWCRVVDGYLWKTVDGMDWVKIDD